MIKENKIWRILDVIRVSENALKEKNIPNARLNAELLLADMLNTKRINLYLDFEKPLAEQELAGFKSKLKRRLESEPLQYILGFTEFYGLRLKVDKRALIPRPETEILVERTLDIIKQINIPGPGILEIGTGSGCISISLANNCDCVICAIDNQNGAIELAKENAETNNVSGKINFELKVFSDDFDLKPYDIIISNPPYIPIAEYEQLPDEIKNYEPRIALTDGKDGFTFYRSIFSIIREKQISIPLLLEIGDGKRPLLENILHTFGIKEFNFYKDYHGIDRVLRIN
jgi:release factor glutamine methyltransferase